MKSNEPRPLKAVTLHYFDSYVDLASSSERYGPAHATGVTLGTYRNDETPQPVTDPFDACPAYRIIWPLVTPFKGLSVVHLRELPGKLAGVNDMNERCLLERKQQRISISIPTQTS